MRKPSVLNVAGLFLICLAASEAAVGAELRTRLRRPVAAVLVDNDTRLLVANRASGSISTINLEAGDVVSEVDVGRALADMVISADGRLLLTVDQVANELIVLARENDALRVVARALVAEGPQNVRIARDGRSCFVTSLWGRAVSVVDLGNVVAGTAQVAGAAVIARIPLPFAARYQCLVADDTRLVVADACGGGLAVIDVAARKVICVRELLGHNVRGMSLSSDGRQLLLAHQILSSQTETLQSHVFWGAVIANVIRALPIEALTTAVNEPLPGAGTQTIGGLGAGAGDPAGVAVTAAGDTIVALSGVQEIAMRRAGQFGWQRERVGRRPTALAIAADGARVFTVNTLGDSISVVDVTDCRVERTIKLGPRQELSAAERGEQHFYDARLSFDGWYSCHSCHTDGHTNGLTSDNFGDDSAGSPKRVLSLLGTGETGPWAWNGRAVRLEDQIHSSLERTMRSRKISTEQVAALGEFLRTLPAPPKCRPPETDRSLLVRGGQVFVRAGCSNCHQPPTYTSAAAYDVGLADESGHDRFNPPSLRGVRLRTALFHDSRAASLEEVVEHYRHGQAEVMSDDDARALLAFLRSL